jgi:hypothetical protein
MGRCVVWAVTPLLCASMGCVGIDAANATSAAAAGTTTPTDIVSAPVVGMTPTIDHQGYWLASADSHVYNFGDAQNYLSPYTSKPGPQYSPTVAILANPEGYDFWLIDADGQTWSNSGAVPPWMEVNLPTLNAPIVGGAVTPDNNGLYMVAADGGVFAFGDARYQGSMGGVHLNEPIIGMALDQATGGYWLVAADGGIFSFNTPFEGSTGAIHLNRPIVGMEASPNGSGYRLVASDGGVFSFNLPFSGSMGGTQLNAPIVGMAADGTNAYWLVAKDGGVFSFGGAPFYGTPLAWTPPPST